MVRGVSKRCDPVAVMTNIPILTGNHDVPLLVKNQDHRYHGEGGLSRLVFLLMLEMKYDERCCIIRCASPPITLSSLPLA